MSKIICIYAYFIAISGGCDSVALTRIFYSFLKKIDLRLELVHFHHGIRKKSDEEADFVLDLAKKLSLKCHLFKNKSYNPLQIFKEKPANLRYQKLDKTKRKSSKCFILNYFIRLDIEEHHLTAYLF